MSLKTKELIKGRGAQLHTKNKFLQLEYVREHEEGLDELWELNVMTQFYEEHAKKIVNRINSPDLGLYYSMNPYQGCEHGCVYCYARNTHEYYGYSAGLDFESKIIVKRNAATVFKKQLEHPSWQVFPIMLSGNTDCYQPAERKFQITRQLLQICLEYRHPVSIITKNSLIIRDTDILQELAKLNLLHVNISITTLQEEIRQKLEPRTATSIKRLKVVEALSKVNIPVRVMAAPIIPFLNSQELPAILKASAEHGALDASYILVCLNGSIGELFTDWLQHSFPEKASRILENIRNTRGGKLNESRFGIRMRGEGEFADMISQLFKTMHRKYFHGKSMPNYDLTAFRRKNQSARDLFSDLDSQE
ncbi:MAG: PA0069 family radical SAM protein [Flavobacteriales bacterium]|nr:PA0069 family radical SAM protein [Flavobacteriales bacterium]